MTYAAAALHPSEDREGLLALWMEVMPLRSERSAAERRLAWLEKNPAGPPAVCVTHHVASNAVVACGSAYPRRTQVGGELLAAGILGDFAVSRAHRVAGAALAVQRKLMNESLARFDFIHGCPNQKAEPIFKRLGFQTVGTTVSFSRVLRSADKLAPLLGSPLAARVAAAFVDRALALTDARARIRRPFAFRAEQLARADERFDALWGRARHHYGITGERSAAYLNWRYADFPARPFRFFAVSRRGGSRSGELCGYVVYSIEDDVVIVGDLFCDDPRVLLEVLLQMFASEMRDGTNRSIYLWAVAGPELEQVLKRCLFFKRPGGKSLIARARTGAPARLASELMERRRWFMIGAEMDT